MNILQAKEEIKNAVKAYLLKDEAGGYRIPVIAQRPILLMGPPGIGKTAIMEQIAKECGIGLVSYTMTHHTRQSAIGLPMIERRRFGEEEYPMTEYTMSEIIGSVYQAMEARKKRGCEIYKEGILFLDEINCVSETLAPTMLQFLQKKMFGNHKVPDGWIIVAAGNPPEYNKSVKEFDIVTLDRVRRMDITEDFGVWKGYAYERGVHPSIITYLEIQKEHFYKIETTAAGKRFVTARGWEDLSHMIYAQELLQLPLSEAVVSQYVQHPKIAKDFANYYDLYNQYKADYHVREILEGHISKNTVERMKTARFDEKLSLIGLLVGALNGCFKDVQAQEDYTQGLYDVLSDIKEEVNESADPRNLILDALIRAQERLDPKADARLLHGLKLYEKCILTGGAFEDVKALFEKEVDALETLTHKGQQSLEAAFDFMEAAFGESQEMVMFITELNTSVPALTFIRTNGCERYYKYNKGLLFASGHEQMQREIESARAYADFMGI